MEDYLQCIPQNDLDCFYNYKWKEIQKLSMENNDLLNNFTIIQEKIDNEMRRFIMNSTFGHGKIMDNMVKFRDSFFNRNDNSKILKIVTRYILNISNFNDLNNCIKIFQELKINTFFTTSVIPHYKEPDIYTLAIGEFPSVFDFDKEKSDEDEKERTKICIRSLNIFYKFIKKNWGYSMSKKNDFIRNVILIDKLFTKSNLTEKASRNPFITHNSEKYIDFLEKYDFHHFWKNILDEYMHSEYYVFFENKKSLLFIKYYFQNINNNDLVMIKDYLVFCLGIKYGSYLSISDDMEEIYQSFLTDEENFVELFYQYFGYYLEDVYQYNYNDPIKYEMVKDMFNKMKNYCKTVFESSNLFNKETSYNALLKLKTLDVIVGTQKYWINLEEAPNLNYDFYKNIMLMDNFYFNKTIKMIGQEVDGHLLSFENDLFSFIINAYYDPLSNLIYVPTSILNDFLFNVNEPIIYNYAGFGSILGHEIMHCFDDYGALFDYNGHLNNWWSKEDYEKYKIEIEKVRNHYSRISLYGIKLDPDTSLSENIADIGGLKISLRTYIRYYMPNTHINNLTHAEKKHLEKYFKKWAETMRTIDNKEYIDLSIKLDEHAPNTIRINAPFSHIKEYYEIYDVTPVHQNYLDKNERTNLMDIN